jgi:hypothetical protein
VSNFAWGLITRRTPKANHPAIVINIKIPRLHRELAQWRNQQLIGIFESVNLLSSDAAPPAPVPVNLATDTARLTPLERTSVKDARTSGTTSLHTSMKDAPSLVPPPVQTSVNVAPPTSATTPNHDLLLAMNQNLVLAMTAHFQKSNARTDNDNDSVDPTTPAVAKFTVRRAAPFYAWAGIHPGHLFKNLPPLFGDLIEASSPEKHGIVTGFFRQLERENPRTFAGFQPSEDLIDDLAKLRLAPPQGHGTKWHRGVGPMAFADRSLTDLDNQATNRDLRLTYNEHLSLSMADARKLESAPPLVPLDFESFLLLLSRFTDFLLGALGPDCDLYRKCNRVVLNLTQLRHRISRSPAFMTHRAPTILWAITLATQDFYAETATATQFATAEANEDDPPRIQATLDVADLSKLQVTTACDLPPFLLPVSLHAPPSTTSPYRPTTSTAPPRNPSTTLTNRAPPVPTPARTGTQPTAIVNPAQAAEFKSFFSIVPPEQRANLGLRKILDGCPDVTYSVLTSKLGGTGTTCLRYHLFGQCGLRTCVKTHAPLHLAPGSASAVCNLLQPGLTALLAHT